MVYIFKAFTKLGKAYEPVGSGPRTQVQAKMRQIVCSEHKVAFSFLVHRSYISKTHSSATC